MKSSKQFLIDRILHQAKLGGVQLTEIEIRILAGCPTTRF
jgi:hypothetical protein